MAFTVSSIAAKDGAPSPVAIGGGMLAGDVAGGGVGPFFLFKGLVDGVAGVNKAQIDSSNRLGVLASIASAQTLAAVTSITNVVHVDDNAGSLTIDAPVATPAFVRLSDGSAAITTLPVSLASVPSHAVTNAGTFAIQENGAALTALQLIDDVIFVDDAAFTPGTSKVAMIGAQLDNTGTDSVDEGDAGALRMSANRNLYVNIRDNAGNERGLNIDGSGQLAVTLAAAQTLGTVTTVSAVTAVGTITPGTAATSLGKAEDAPHASGDVGVMALAVRQDSQTNFAADGDYVPLSIDGNGALRVSGGGGGTQYTEDVGAATDPVGNMLIAVRRDTLSTSEVSGDGDNIAVKATSRGQLHTASDLATIKNVAVSVGAGSVDTGTQRMAIASDSAGVITTGTAGSASTQVVTMQGIASMTPVLTTAQASTNTQEIVGDAAHDAAAAGNPVLVGGYASAAAPAAVSADADVVRAWRLLNGAAATVLTAAGALIGGDATNGLDVDVTRLPSLVAGNANIGDVDIATITAGETHIGEVGGKSAVVAVTLSTDTSAYASGDLIADTQQIDAFFRKTDGTGVINSINIIDEDAQGVALYILFLSTNTSLGTENSAPNISDANLTAGFQGMVAVAASDYVTVSGTKVATIKNIGLPVKAVSGTDDIYIAVLNATGTPTFTAAGLEMRIGVLLD
jgi:hypothetical protein